MKPNFAHKLRRRRRRTLRRIKNRHGTERDRAMIAADNIHDELADRIQGLSAGGNGAMFLLARRTGQFADIDQRFHPLSSARR